MKTLFRHLPLALLLCMGSPVALLAQAHTTPLPEPWEARLQPLIADACACGKLLHQQADEKAFVACMEKIAPALSNLEQEAMQQDRAVASAIRPRFEAGYQACDQELRNALPLSEEDRARLRNAYHTEYAARLDREEVLVMAEEVAKLVCACRTAKVVPGELPCSDRLEIASSLFAQRYRDDTDQAAAIQARIQPILDQCP
jgi:hypothetical protein